MIKKTFKDFLNQDIGNVFINPNEFADIHTLNKVEMAVVVDEDSFDEFSGRSAEMDYAMQGIYQTSKTIYVKSTDFDKPEVGEHLNLDGERYIVTSASESAGLLKINLVSNES